MSLLAGIDGPADLRRLGVDERVRLCAEIRDLLVRTVAQTGGHIGPNLGVVELTVALHTVFDSPADPILFDTGHQTYVHKILTGRRDNFGSLRQTDGLSGYPSRAESPHDWIENSHASTALSYADGLSKARDIRGDRRPVVAVVGDGALTGGMSWEALNNIAAADRPVVIVVNDNGRSYAPTIGGLADHLAGLRLQPSYERALDGVKELLGRTPYIGSAVYDALHGIKRGMKDLLAPQGMFEDLGLKYVGPIDGHDLAAVERALTLAKNFGKPVVVHVVTQKGRGYPPAVNDDIEQMHSPGPFRPDTGELLARPAGTWTSVFSDEIISIGEARPDLVAITAAMCEPTGLGPFSRRFPDRFYDVGIAEQHAMTSAAGLASGGMHPVVAIYATFLNRAFDQLLMDVALHRLPVTIVLDRAGVTGSDGPTHNGVWDYAMLGMVPGIAQAAPRDELTLRAELREAVAIETGPSVVRFPKTPLVAEVPATRSFGAVDVLFESDDVGTADVLVISVGAMAVDAVAAAHAVVEAGFTVRVVDPRWVKPLPPEIVELARQAGLIVTIEDGILSGGVGSRIAQLIREAGIDTPTREVGVPTEFLEHGKVGDVRARIGLTAESIGRRVIGWATPLVPARRMAR
ncbi:1-deoxy-D-xylulose-5-phosphate synthase [Actinoplanes sp. TBRC 11911]|uniref:1-deoxy-D-xylulose-5-phosphate synthase n=1 Tax=Actinoplanes sp. TBRC 11911 TaxID=2729386 RepID=UPI00145E8006|nr:1-deoxy-D-xylulose-5-phosphate synthase [Actinoplanes sp. TBRC 11911]NMO50064.1 1-deoxy-D-xylulose-5-phosphate synthase [Actinoplanes sp. TBRC 11911]